MARVVFICCCGASVDIRGWPMPDVDAEQWHKVHFLCAAAWQREHGGMKTTITYPEDETDDVASG